jgi:hypothetical protein
MFLMARHVIEDVLAQFDVHDEDQGFGGSPHSRVLIFASVRG